MRLLVHQLRKDTRRLWPLLVVWGLVLVVQLVIGVTAWDAEEGALLRRLPETLIQLHRLLAVLVAALVILEEPLVGRRAFWLTRPLPRGGLMASKALFLLVYLALPAVVAELAALTVLGLEAERWGAVISEAALHQVAFLMLVAVLAVFSSSLRAFALIGVIALIAATFGRFWLHLVLDQLVELDVAASTTLDGSREVLQDLLIVLLGGTVVAHQYLTRETRRSIVLAVASALIVHLAAQLSPVDFLRPRASLDPQGFRLTIEEAPTGFSYSKLEAEEDEKRRLYGLLKLEGTLLGQAYGFARIEGRLDLVGGPTLRSTRRGSGGAGSDAALDLALGVPVTPSRSSVGALDDLLVVSESDYARWAETPGSYRARIEVVAYRFEVMGALPLVPGSALGRGLDRIWVDEVTIEPSRLDLLLRRSFLRPAFGPRPQYDESLFLLRHRRSGEVWRPTGIGRGGRGVWLLGGQSDGVVTLVLSRPQACQGTEQVEVEGPFDSEWLRQAELVVVRPIGVGSFVLPLEIEGFRMAEFTLESWEERAEKAHSRRVPSATSSSTGGPQAADLDGRARRAAGPGQAGP